MSNIKNFGIVGIGNDVQFGKGGARLIQESGSFSVKNATGNAFVKLQVADATQATEAVTFGQLTNAISAISSDSNAIQSEIDAIESAVGLDSEGNFVAPTLTTYLDGSTSVLNALTLLDAALLAEVSDRSNAVSELAGELAGINSNAAAETSSRLAADTQLGLDIANAAANIVSEAGLRAAGDAALGSDVANVAADLVSEAGTRADADSALANSIASTDANAVVLDGRVTALEEASTGGLANALQAISDETNARISADSDLSSDISGVASDLSSETLARISGDSALANSIASTDANAVAETNARVAADAQLASDIANTSALASNEANARIAADSALASDIANTNANVASVIVAYEAADSDLTSAIASTDSNVASEVAARIAADSVLTNAVANAAAAVVTEANARAAADAALGSDIANVASDVAGLSDALDSTNSNVATLASNVLLKDGSVALTGDLDFAGFTAGNVATPVNAGDVANKSYVDSKVSSLGNAFNYVSTVSGGVDAGSAFDLSGLSQKDTGDYYKVTVAGYFTDGTTTFYANMNDGIVKNLTAEGWDVIDNTDSTVAGTVGYIDVTGSADTGFTVDISATYTAARQLEVTNEANARIAADVAMASDIANAAGAVSSEANARIAADAALGSDIANVASDLATEISDRTDADSTLTSAIASTDSNVATEVAARIAGDATLTNAVALVNANATTETAARIAGDAQNASDIANVTTAYEAADAALTLAVANVAADLVSEANTRATADSVLDLRVTALEESTSGEMANTLQLISDETNARVAADLALGSDIANTNANVSTLSGGLASTDANVAGLVSDLSDETDARVAADSALGSDIANVASNVASITASYEAADVALASDIANVAADLVTEANARAAADSVLTSALANAQTEIDAIEAGAGLSVAGAYAANAGSHYLANATSLFNADTLLDSALFALEAQLENLTQDEIVSLDGHTSVKAANSAVQFYGNVGGVKTQTGSILVGSATDTTFTIDQTTAGEVKLAAGGSGADVDLRLTAQGDGHVIIGDTGTGYIAADAGYDLILAGGTSGGNVDILGTAVNVKSDAGDLVAQFNGVDGATAYATFGNGDTAVTIGATGASPNVDLVFAPKNNGVVSMSGAKVSNVANAVASTDAVNKGQLDTAISAAKVGSVQAISATVTEVDGTVTIGVIAGTVARVKVLVTGAFGIGATLTVGKTSVAADLASASDIDESAAGIYLIETFKDYSAGETVTFTVAGSTLGGTGSATIFVEYVAS